METTYPRSQDLSEGLSIQEDFLLLEEAWSCVGYYEGGVKFGGWELVERRRIPSRHSLDMVRRGGEHRKSNRETSSQIHQGPRLSRNGEMLVSKNSARRKRAHRQASLG